MKNPIYILIALALSCVFVQAQNEMTFVDFYQIPKTNYEEWNLQWKQQQPVEIHQQTGNFLDGKLTVQKDEYFTFDTTTNYKEFLLKHREKINNSWIEHRYSYNENLLKQLEDFDEFGNPIKSGNPYKLEIFDGDGLKNFSMQKRYYSNGEMSTTNFGYNANEFEDIKKLTVKTDRPIPIETVYEVDATLVPQNSEKKVDGRLTEKSIYTYDNDQIIKIETTQHEKSSFDTKKIVDEREFDEYLRLKKRTISGAKTLQQNFHYKTDDYGNWIIKYTQNSLGKNMVEIRQIKYNNNVTTGYDNLKDEEVLRFIKNL